MGKTNIRLVDIPSPISKRGKAQIGVDSWCFVCARMTDGCRFWQYTIETSKTLLVHVVKTNTSLNNPGFLGYHKTAEIQP